MGKRRIVGVIRGEQTFTLRDMNRIIRMTPTAARRSSTEDAKPAKLSYSHCYVRVL
jgi:hypothetical protein